MWRHGLPFGRNADALALEANAASARLALACAYSSSDEFEADVIRSRREAGVYGPRRQRRAVAAVAIATATVLIAAMAFVIP